MRPQYTGMKVLQTLACGKEKGGGELRLQGRGAPGDPCRAHLDELVLGAELIDDDILAVRDAGQGDAQAPAGALVGVGGQGLHQAAADGLHQVEGGMQRAQEPLPGLLRHLDDVGTGLAWGSRAKGQGPALLDLAPPYGSMPGVSGHTDAWHPLHPGGIQGRAGGLAHSWDSCHLPLKREATRNGKTVGLPTGTGPALCPVFPNSLPWPVSHQTWPHAALSLGSGRQRLNSDQPQPLPTWPDPDPPNPAQPRGPTGQK